MSKQKSVSFAAALTALQEAGDAGAWRAFDILFTANPQPMWIYERKTLRFLAVNNAAVETYGYSEDEFLSMTLAEIRPEEEISRLLKATAGAGTPGYRVSKTWCHRTSRGEIIHVNIHSHLIDYQGKEAVLIAAVDVSELVNTIGQLETQKAYFQQLFDNSPEGIVLLDRTGAILEANKGFQRMFGYSFEELVGRTPLSLIVPDDGAVDSMRAFNSNVVDDTASRLTTLRRKKNGELLDVEVLAYPLKVNDDAQGVFAIYQDVTEKRRALHEIEYQARHDTLTGLSNRIHLAETVNDLLSASTADTPHAFLYIDLDQFKVINDTFGHSVGDRALIEVANLLKSRFRDTDLVARLGGDEFGVLLRDCNERAAFEKAEEVLAAIKTYNFFWEGRSFPVGASIGVVELGKHVSSLEEALNTADAACYAAKHAGRNRVRAYRSDDADIALRRTEMTWVSRLRRAIDDDRFVLFFQEIHPLNGALPPVRHKEILLRYKDDEGALVSPGAFVPSAERYGLMPAVDRWVLKTTCERLRERSDELMVSVNLSGTTLSDDTFAEFVTRTVKSAGIDPGRLCFEITETAAISNLVSAQKLISALKNMGSSISLDDFGCGMSSFNYLRTLSVDYLKIDGTFIRELHTNPIDYAMTEAINHLGKILGLKTIAEFVESREICEKLEKIGVDYAQGYGIHKPELWK